MQALKGHIKTFTLRNVSQSLQSVHNPQFFFARKLQTAQGKRTVIGTKQFPTSRFPSLSSSSLGNHVAEPLLPSATYGIDQAERTKSSTSLARLPLSQVLRTYFATAISTSPLLLDKSIWILRRIMASQNPVISIEHNPLLRWILKKTFYAQFCAGENKTELQSTANVMRQQGFQGLIIEFALEVLKPKVGAESPSADCMVTKMEIEKWRRGVLQSIEVANEGDYVALKWSGLGTHALALLKAQKPPTPLMASALHDACDAAVVKGVGILPGAEEEATNRGIDMWTMDLQKQYNAPLRSSKTVKLPKDQQSRSAAPSGRATVFTTYQCLLRSTPLNLSRHLASAHANNHVLGVKLVRGAYLASEPPSAVCSSIEETHRSYDELAESLLRRQWGGRLSLSKTTTDETSTAPGFPEVDLVLATHNAASVRKAIAICKEQQQPAVSNGNVVARRPAIAQLMGMADEVSSELQDECRVSDEKRATRLPRPVKSATWGSLEDCLNFLLRRAAENRDAAGRTGQSKLAMREELARRSKAFLGL